jgi:hypothetical protein
MAQRQMAYSLLNRDFKKNSARLTKVMVTSYLNGADIPENIVNCLTIL